MNRWDVHSEPETGRVRAANQTTISPVVAAVGGSDPSAGAGIQADLRTLEMFGVTATTVVTALTVQDGLRVDVVEAVAADLVERQLRSVLEAFPPRAIKVGLLPNAEVVARVSRIVRDCGVPLVVDPVLRATAGPALVEGEVADALAAELFPSATAVTFNVEEAERFSGATLTSLADLEEAARALASCGSRSVVIKGGHLSAREGADRVTDVLWDGRRIHRFSGQRQREGDLHGSGCAFASATAAGVAGGMTIAAAVARAGEHVRALMAEAVDLGHGILLRQPPPAGR